MYCITPDFFVESICGPSPLKPPLAKFIHYFPVFPRPIYGFDTGKNSKPRTRTTVDTACHRRNDNTDKLDLSEQ